MFSVLLFFIYLLLTQPTISSFLCIPTNVSVCVCESVQWTLYEFIELTEREKCAQNEYEFDLWMKMVGEAEWYEYVTMCLCVWVYTKTKRVTSKWRSQRTKSHAIFYCHVCNSADSIGISNNDCSSSPFACGCCSLLSNISCNFHCCRHVSNPFFFVSKWNALPLLLLLLLLPCNLSESCVQINNK